MSSGSDTAWSKNAMDVSKQTVMIETTSNYGTGFLSHAAHDLRVIAVAKHVVKDSSNNWHRQVRIHYGHGKAVAFGPGSGKDILMLEEKDESADSAMLMVKATELPQPHVPLLERGTMIVVGVEVGWLGFPSIANGRLCFFSGRISSTEPDGRRYLVDGVAIPGVSGGPVFCETENGLRIIGSISAYEFTTAQATSMANEQHQYQMPGLSVVTDVSLLTQLVVKEAAPGEGMSVKVK